MTSQNSSLSIPPEWEERFLIKRIGEEDIEISLKARDAILQALESGARFIQIGKYTLMLNSIKSIDPRWEPNNIPPRPRENVDIIGTMGNVAKTQVTNQAEIDLWDQLYGGKEQSLQLVGENSDEASF